MTGHTPFRPSSSANDLALVRELAAGAALLVVTGFAAVVLLPGGEPAGRVLIMAVACGVMSALFGDWRARAAVMAASVLVFVGFLGRGSADLSGGTSAWAYTPIFLLAVMLGGGYRSITHEPKLHCSATHHGYPDDSIFDN